MDQQKCPHLTPNTGDWHVWNVGILIGNLQSLEFIARMALVAMTGSQSGVDLHVLRPGQLVPEDPMTNYDQLGAVLGRFNALASSSGRLIDVQRIVDLRDQLAHGRTVAKEPAFPLTLLKFERPVRGQVQVSARIEMTEAWFLAQRKLVHEAIQMVGDELSGWRLERLR